MMLLTIQKAYDDPAANLYWYFGIAAALIFAIVAFLTFFFVRKYRMRSKDDIPDHHPNRDRFEIAMLIVVASIVAFFLVYSLRLMDEIQDIPDNPKPDIIITGHQWWWEAEYPKTGVITANEIHMPVGKRVLIQLNAADVIHSWWVPALGRKMDMIPGYTRYMWLYADTSGQYLGTCSEFCGAEHARMRIRVFAQEQADFDQWTQQQLQPVVETGTPLFEKGKQIFEERTCTNCHAINGTDYKANIGPNLTHFASRTRFLSDFKANTKENLTAWLHDPQKVKRGAKMPDFILSNEEVNALVAYISNLK